ncbi:hypothetical protein DFH08DRAFT_1081136 [Mycena albidolilacea]|uniref:Uncharacterized protein n=1 Tax=Mycena albidolilacea TaxID=1033008 RepID=A0AAD6ZZ14_9AGAR|nr:hypothetical protein DFH08DRAFT_1081136 [Mycena albidolilacea]
MHAMEGAAARNMTSPPRCEQRRTTGSHYRPQSTDASRIALRKHTRWRQRGGRDKYKQRRAAKAHRTWSSRVARSGNAHDGGHNDVDLAPVAHWQRTRTRSPQPGNKRALGNRVPRKGGRGTDSSYSQAGAALRGRPLSGCDRYQRGRGQEVEEFCV